MTKINRLLPKKIRQYYSYNYSPSKPKKTNYNLNDNYLKRYKAFAKLSGGDAIMLSPYTHYDLYVSPYSSWSFIKHLNQKDKTQKPKNAFVYFHGYTGNVRNSIKHIKGIEDKIKQQTFKEPYSIIIPNQQGYKEDKAKDVYRFLKQEKYNNISILGFSGGCVTTEYLARILEKDPNIKYKAVMASPVWEITPKAIEYFFYNKPALILKQLLDISKRSYSPKYLKDFHLQYTLSPISKSQLNKDNLFIIFNELDPLATLFPNAKNDKFYNDVLKGYIDAKIKAISNTEKKEDEISPKYHLSTLEDSDIYSYLFPKTKEGIKQAI